MVPCPMIGKTLIVIDDNPGDVELLTLAYEKSPLGPMQVRCWAQPSLALDELPRESFMTVPILAALLDLSLVRAAGADFIDRLQSITCFTTLPIVFWSSMSGTTGTDRMVRRNRILLVKPVDWIGFCAFPEQLMSAIKSTEATSLHE